MTAFSDNFDTGTLAAGWTEAGASGTSVTSGNSVSGATAANFTVGTGHYDYYSGTYDGPQIFQSISNSQTSWSITIKVLSLPYSNSGSPQSDNGIFIILRNGANSPSIMFGMYNYAGTFAATGWTTPTFNQIGGTSSSPVPSTVRYYRVTRTGNNLQFFYSSDGTTWTEVTSNASTCVSYFMGQTGNSITEVGIVNQAYETGGAGWTISVDYFDNSLAPLSSGSVASTSGSAAGTGSASASAAAIIAASGAAAGAGTASGDGAATAAGRGGAAGAGTGAGDGAATVASAGGAAGAGSASGEGATTATSDGSALGAGAASGGGAAVATSDGSAAGSGSVVGDGTSEVAATGSSSGAASASGVGGAPASTSGSAAGGASVSGAAGAASSAEGTSAGIGAAAGEAGATTSSDGSAPGAATASGKGGATVAGVGSSSGAATTGGDASATADAAGTAPGKATAGGDAGAMATAAGTAAGAGAASGDGGAQVPADGASAGTASVSGGGGATSFIFDPDYYAAQPVRTFVLAPLVGARPLAAIMKGPVHSFTTLVRNKTMITFSSAIDPLEVQTLTLGGENILPTGVTLVSAGAAVITAVHGRDTTPSTRFGAPAVNTTQIVSAGITIPVGTAVQLLCSYPVDGEVYEIRVPCAGSDGATYVLKAKLKASAD